jgi:RNA polymerase sigma-70 factor (ECF subfamily)
LRDERDVMRRRPYRGRTDAELLAAARTDAKAFRALYDRHAEAIHGYHLRRAKDPHAALDLTAETFARAWTSRAAFRDEAGGSLAPWLHGIARHVLLDSVRKGALERAACIAERRGEEPAAAPDESWLDDADELLDSLPEDQRAAVRLRVLDDLPYERVAAALDTTPGAARVRVHRGLAALRRDPRLDEELS